MLYERQQQIINFMKEKHFATVKELAATVYSSESSVRRDIKALESAGYVKQIYGGAVLTEYENSVVPLNLRDTSNSATKEQIAKMAAQYLFNEATVIMDGSSTVRRIIKYAGNYSGIKIITNNQKIFDECRSNNLKLYCTGGMFSPQGNIFLKVIFKT